MDKRFFLALALSVVVIFLTQRLFPSPSVSKLLPPAKQDRNVDSIKSGLESSGQIPRQRRQGPALELLETSVLQQTGKQTPFPETAGETVTISTSKVRYQFSAIGAMPISAALIEYRSLSQKGRSVQLERPGQPLLYLAGFTGVDTLRLDRVAFTVDTVPGTGQGTGPLIFRGRVGGWDIALTYSFAPDSYQVRVRLDAHSGSGEKLRKLGIMLPGGLRSEEADTLDDQRHLAYVAKPVKAGARSISFTKLDPHETLVEVGPLAWVASKNKYFLLAVLSPVPSANFESVIFTGGPRAGKMAINADAMITVPVQPDGGFAFELYTGPQAWRRLTAVGRDLEHVNPYGGFLRGVVEPFASFVMWAVLGLHDRLRVSYGWVLVVFGVVVRLILWPLNQRAMRSNLKMQRVQPELQEIQKRYAKQPEKQHAEMMRVYKEHGMSPFSMFSGCLPMLLPMPVLFALFFVFQNTIEFRGVSFLWLHDISQKDPYYILPALMGISMFFLSWIGMRNTPPNPQAKTMTYVFPVMMTAFFLNLASGLNLYYAVQNIAALPQQWLIARERSRSSPSARK
ncbi:MAG: membrane protein insertase YidC [Gemmatimonadaceae bacterium]